MQSRNQSNTLTIDNTNITTKAANGFGISNSAGNGTTFIKSPTGSFTNTLTVPSTTGTAGQVLSTDGTGILSWANIENTASEVITPTQLTSDQNNWNPTGLSTARIIQVTGDLGLRTITGITAPTSATSYREITIVNTGTNTILFTHLDTNSLADNRFDLPKVAMGLYADCSITFYYDNAGNVWRVKAHSPYTETFLKNFYWPLLSRSTNTPTPYVMSGNIGTVSDFGTNINGRYGSMYNVNTGSAVGGAGQIMMPLGSNWTALNSSTSRTNLCSIVSAKIRIAALSTTTDRFILKIGLIGDNTSNFVATGTVKGTYFIYSDNIGGGNIIARTSNGSTNTDVNAVVSPSTTPYYTLEVVLLPTNEALFYVDRVLMARNANTNIPANTEFYPGIGIVKTVGAVNRNAYLSAFIHEVITV